MRGGARAGRGRRDALCASAAPRPARASALAAAAAVAAVILALVPLSVGVSPAALPYVQESEALAASGGGSSGFYDATGFVDEVAQAISMAPSRLVSTVIGVVGGATGLNLADGEISPDLDLSQNLDALAAAANYPDWELLTDAQREGWGSKANYDAAKFNDLLIAFGQDESLARYKASDGGDFDFTEDEIIDLESLAQVGETWANRGSVALSELQDLVTREQVVTAYGPVTKRLEIPSGDSYWPADLPRTVSVVDSQTLYAIYPDRAYRTYYFNASSRVKILCFTTGNRNSYLAYSESGFMMARGNRAGDSVVDFPTPNLNPYTIYTDSTNTDVAGYAYWDGFAVNAASLLISSNCYFYDWNDNPNYFGPDRLTAMTKSLLGLRDEDARPSYITIIEYPSTPPGGETPVYYPETDGTQKIERDTPWEKFVTVENPPYTPPTPEERPENPFNPSDTENPSYQSGTPEWKQETTENLEPALNIRFDKLFPFCLIYDIELFWNKMKSVMIGDPALGEQAVNDYEHLSIPGLETVEGMENGIEFDLQPLREMLNLIKPYMFWLLLITMIMSVVEFWRRILTGA